MAGTEASPLAPGARAPQTTASSEIAQAAATANAGTTQTATAAVPRATTGTAPLTANPSHPRLDPRAKLYVLLLANLMLFFHARTHVEVVMVALFLLPFFPSGRMRTGLRLAATYLALLAIDLLVIPVASGFALSFLSMLSVGIRMLLPCVITGTYAFTTTTVGEFVCAMRRMRVPETVIIPCMVVIRFFPTIREDYRQIRSAMALRGIATGRLALLRHPMQSLEYILMPLLMNSNNVAQDLSVAALTKGIGLPGEHTCMTQIRMTAADWLYMVACTVPLAAFIGGLW